ncbi:phosphotransferase [Zavarzinia sp. CC-PAN008]|uniref:phosphotransferase n=1 Tax=Zavarzinia sp. CC-PAN008 TaxID=3243332 RepID=UPI003F744122
MAKVRTPVELIELYWNRVWNNREVELIREICADPIIRHDIQSTVALSHEEQIARVRESATAMEPYFTHEVLLGDDTHVCSVWNMYTRAGGERRELSGIEVFRAENGRFTNCWNSTYTKGFWGRVGDAPRVLPPPELLYDVKQISYEWLQKVFAKAGVKVPHIAMADVAPIGHGNVSTTVRVRPGYNAAAGDAPRTVICKFDTKVPECIEYAVQGQSYRREVESYRLLGTEPPLNVPRVYHSELDEAGRTLNLVLEDVPGAVPGDQIAGCSIDQAKAVVHELAGLHARFWQSPALDGLSWLMRRKDDPARSASMFAQGAAIYRERFTGRLSEQAFKVIEQVIPLMEGWAATEPTVRTLIHGDPRVDNVLFDMSNPDAPRAYLIDWQVTSQGDPQHDLAYFLTGSLLPEERKACERDLIAAHAATIRKVDPSYTLERALEAYRLNIIAGLQATVAAALPIPSTPHTDKLLMTLAERNCAAVLDWGGVEAIARAISVPA